YFSDSGCGLDWSVESEEEAAALIRALPDLGLGCGVVISNPLPPEEQLDPALHERALRSGLEELERRGISGKEVTPFLLEHFREQTGGESLRANERLVIRNARLAARIARHLSGRG
ncbi:MAG: pseudouridine-5'-phosphate glycosidase, partial [Rubrobacter sp.]|nr:pseudouridine-5'-phosphate glycosidase [Rubrobacter sp.]